VNREEGKPVSEPAASAPVVDPNACPACKKIHSGSDAATLRKLASTPDRLTQLAKRLDAKGLAASYGPGKWTIRQIVCHLRDCELMYGVRMRQMLSMDHPTLQPFDQDAWAGAARYDRQDAARAIATLAEVRAGNLEMLKLAGAGALARGARHPDYGDITVGQLVRHLLAHDENHLRHVESARASSSSGRKRGKAAPRAKSGKRRSGAQ